MVHRQASALGSPPLCSDWASSAGSRVAPSRSSTAEGRAERFTEIAAELVRLKVDIILAGGTEAAVAAKQATSVIPIVFPSAGDPIGSGLVTSLARPGGNVTGLSNLGSDIAAKRFGLLRDVLPELRRLAVMAKPVFQAMLGNAVHVCEAKFGSLLLCDGDLLRPVARHNQPPELVAALRKMNARAYRVDQGTAMARAVRTKQIVHIADIKTEPRSYLDEPAAAVYLTHGVRTLLAVPLCQKNAAWRYCHLSTRTAPIH